MAIAASRSAVPVASHTRLDTINPLRFSTSRFPESGLGIHAILGLSVTAATREGISRSDSKTYCHQHTLDWHAVEITRSDAHGHRQLHAAFLNVQDSISGIALREDRLFFSKRLNLSSQAG
jgi:hypothetical protein